MAEPVRYLSLVEVLELHRRVVERTGGATGLRDLGALQSALAQPRASYGGELLYPTLEEQAAALGYSLVLNPPFVDGNKRVGHVAMAVFLALNGPTLVGDVDESERIMLALAGGQLSREQLVEWIRRSSHPRC